MPTIKDSNNSIFEIIKEVEKEIEEATTGGSIAGYETPNAFGDDSKKSKKKTKDVSTQAGYTVVAGAIENINEAMPKSIYSSQNYIKKLTPKITIAINKIKKHFPQYKISVVPNRGNNTGTYTLDISGYNTKPADDKRIDKLVKSLNLNEATVKKIPKFSELPRTQQLQKMLDHLNSLEIDGAKNSVEKVVKLSKERHGWKVTYKSKPGFVDDRDSQYASDFIYPHELGESIVSESPNEGKLLPKKLTDLKMGELFSFDGKTYQFIELRPGKDSAKVKDKNGNVSVNSFGGGLVNRKSQGSGFGDYLSQGGRIWDNKNITNVDIVESKKAKPRRNRWLDLKNDESMHPHKKLAVGLKELRNQLTEVEQFLGWYNKLKNINELDTDNYWKRTNSNIYKIKERIINIARTLKEIEQ